MRSSTKWVALVVAASVAVLSVAELTSERFRDFTQDHPLIATFLTEAVRLIGVYLVIDEIIQRRESRRWGDVTSLGMRALATRAQGPATIVREAVGVLVQGTAEGEPALASSGDAVDLEQLVLERRGVRGLAAQ